MQAELEKACTVALETMFEAKDAKLGTDSKDELMEFVMKVPHYVIIFFALKSQSSLT